MRILKMLFSLEGRINRVQFWCALAIIATFSGLMFSAVRFVSGSGPTDAQSTRVMSAIVFCLGLFVFAWTLIAVSTKRWHDMKLSGLMSLLWLIPLVGPLVVIGWLGFGRGKNRHSTHRAGSSQSGYE